MSKNTLRKPFRTPIYRLHLQRMAARRMAARRYRAYCAYAEYQESVWNQAVCAHKAAELAASAMSAVNFSAGLRMPPSDLHDSFPWGGLVKAIAIYSIISAIVIGSYLLGIHHVIP